MQTNSDHKDTEHFVNKEDMSQSDVMGTKQTRKEFVCRNKAVFSLVLGTNNFIKNR
jgi:hypothetical protein